MTVAMLPPLDLRPTEAIDPRRIRDVIALLVASQSWTHPICVERTTHAILDGHHRRAAAIQLGLTRVPVRLLDYAEVDLGSWRTEIRPTRAEVLERARSGRLYPAKTTRHTFVDLAMPEIGLARLMWALPGHS